jgi:hypothetical protein
MRRAALLWLVASWRRCGWLLHASRCLPLGLGIFDPGADRDDPEGRHRYHQIRFRMGICSRSMVSTSRHAAVRVIIASSSHPSIPERGYPARHVEVYQRDMAVRNKNTLL